MSTTKPVPAVTSLSSPDRIDNPEAPLMRAGHWGGQTPNGWVRNDTPGHILASEELTALAGHTPDEEGAQLFGVLALIVAAGTAVQALIAVLGVPGGGPGWVVGTGVPALALASTSGWMARKARREKQKLAQSAIGSWIVPLENTCAEETYFVDMERAWKKQQAVVAEFTYQNDQALARILEEEATAVDALHQAHFNKASRENLEELARYYTQRARVVSEEVLQEHGVVTSAPNSPIDVDDTRARLDRVRELYGAYLSDPLEVLTYPKLNDLAQPDTAAFVRAYTWARDLATSSNADKRELHDAVLDAETTWARAWQAAELAKDSPFTSDQRARARRARSLLAKVLDPAATPAEASQAWQKAQESLEGVLILPQPSLSEINKRTRVLTQG